MATSPTYLLVILVTTVGLVRAVCPDVNRQVNCSFTSAEECLDLYQRYDRHGLKWHARQRGVAFHRSTTSSRYPYNTVTATTTTLDTSPSENFLYIFGNDDTRTHGLWTDLVSPPVTVNHRGCLYFKFHNNVCRQRQQHQQQEQQQQQQGWDPLDIHLKVLLRADNGSQVTLRELPCINTSAWYDAKIPVEGVHGTYSLVFSARQQSEVNQTIGVDDVIYSDRSCSIRSDLNYAAGDCDFEDSDWCGYRTWTGGDSDTVIRWLPIQKEMIPSESNRVMAPDGYFMALLGHQLAENSSRRSVSAALESPEVFLESPGCLSLRYYNGRYIKDNDNKESLVVYLVTEDDNSTVVSELEPLPATLWDESLQVFLPLDAGQFRIQFNVTLTLPYGDVTHDVILLDDIEVHGKSCDRVRCDDVICEVPSQGGCSGRGTCLGTGRKHKSCKCLSGYMGKECEF